MMPSPMKALGRNRGERTPDELHLAVITGRVKRIKRLIRKGVHIESVNCQGQTPLFSASFGGDLEVVNVLLRLGANPNRSCGQAGASPLHAAAYRGSRRVLRSLVESGGDLSIRDSQYLTPRDYALKQPSPIRRQKILDFLDVLSAMTLHQMGSTAGLAPTGTLPSNAGILPDSLSRPHSALRSEKRRSYFGGSQMTLSRRSSHQSTSSVWSSCISDTSSVSTDDLDVRRPRSEVVVTPNLHQNISCHLLDQLCVTTSLPLVSPGQLKRPVSPSPAYTCGGPTVYSSFTWMGTPVTVRRPTPALSMKSKGLFHLMDTDDSAPDQDAVKSLLQELAFLRRLRHPGFLEVMAACHVAHPSPDHVTLVYQHVAHGSLFHHMHVQHNDLSVGCAVDIMIGLVEALLFIHAHGFFHAALSSHALHLVDLRNAKLGGFEYAFETQVKGVGMRAEHLSKANWLMGWQAPETVLERMVSLRTEVYAVAAIIWEIWSGTAPWSGVEEAEMKARLAKGEVLPSLTDTSLSLVSYLTEYGLKWAPNQRELDLQEIHTMLRSLRIQCNEEDRVPSVISWSAPSVVNASPIDRNSASSNTSSVMSSSATSSSYGEIRSSILTSTPIKPTINLTKNASRPDILPNRVTPKVFLSSTQSSSNTQPDLLNSGIQSSRKRDKNTHYTVKGNRNSEENYAFVRNAAKRAFFQQRDNSDESDATTSSSLSSPSTHRDRRYSGLRTSAKSYHDSVVKRGLSLSNICSSALNCSSATIFTRTTSHISLSSNKSSSSRDSFEKKPPQRTISHITLTLKKLSVSSSSSSSVGSNADNIIKVNHSINNNDSEKHQEPMSTQELEGSSPTIVKEIETKHSETSAKSISYQKKSIKDYQKSVKERCVVDGSLSTTSTEDGCSKSSTDASLTSKGPSTLSKKTLQESLSKFEAKPHTSRPLSVFVEKGASSNCPPSSSDDFRANGSYTLPGAVRTRRSSETGARHRNRRTKRRHDLEFEESFIDDEFDANLFAQPHMQLSVSSAENLLDNTRSPTQLSLSGSSNISRDELNRLTSSEGEEDSCRKTPEGKSSSDDIAPCRTELNPSPDVPVPKSDFQDSPKSETREKVKALTLDRNFSHYLPKHSFISDSEDISDG